MERMTRASAAKPTSLQGAPLKKVNLSLGLQQPRVALAAGGLELAVKSEIFAGTVIPAAAVTGPGQVRDY